MPSLFDPGVRESLAARLSRLTADTRPRWGKFTAAKMVAHLNGWSRMATGEMPTAPAGPAVMRLAPMRWFIIHLMPWPRGAPTAPELLAGGDAAEFEAEMARYRPELDKVFARVGRGPWPAHPGFGVMTEREWGHLGWRHTDHHLRQFGL